MAFLRSYNINDDKPASGPECFEIAEPGGKSEGVGTRHPWVQASTLLVINCKFGQTSSLQALSPQL